MANDSTDEEDYMSDAFLAKCSSDVRPGLVSKHIARQYENEAKHRRLNALNREQNKPRSQLETEKREEGLKNALTSDNKGFKLLEKMGYKPGTAIGKKGVGHTEPIPLEVKVHREGLGQETERKRKIAEQRAMRAVMARKRQRHELEWKQNIRAKVASRETEKDLIQSQKVCEQLDNSHGVQYPERKFYWPLELLPPDDDGDGGDDDDDRDDDCDDDHDVTETTEDDESLSLDVKLEILTHYLRSMYNYCVWCGTTFNDDDDMSSNCPGDTAQLHDS